MEQVEELNKVLAYLVQTGNVIYSQKLLTIITDLTNYVNTQTNVNNSLQEQVNNLQAALEEFQPE